MFMVFNTTSQLGVHRSGLAQILVKVLRWNEVHYEEFKVEGGARWRLRWQSNKSLRWKVLHLQMFQLQYSESSEEGKVVH